MYHQKYTSDSKNNNFEIAIDTDLRNWYNLTRKNTELGPNDIKKLAEVKKIHVTSQVNFTDTIKDTNDISPMIEVYLNMTFGENRENLSELVIMQLQRSLEEALETDNCSLNVFIAKKIGVDVHILLIKISNRKYWYQRKPKYKLKLNSFVVLPLRYFITDSSRKLREMRLS